jgi:hypothetical protein
VSFPAAGAAEAAEVPAPPALALPEAKPSGAFAPRLVFEKGSATVKQPLFVLQTTEGFSLVGVLLSLVLGLISATLFSMGFLLVTKSSYFVQQTATRTELHRACKNAVLEPRALLQTAAMNPYLDAVLRDDFAGTGPVNTNQFYPLSLYDAAGTRVAGTDVDPVYYRIDGTVCPPTMGFGNGDCLISVTASFMAEGLPSGLHYRYLSSVNTLPVSGYTTVEYPVSSPGLKAELVLVVFEINFFQKPGTVPRKPDKGSTFINLRDLGF